MLSLCDNLQLDGRRFGACLNMKDYKACTQEESSHVAEAELPLKIDPF